MKDWQKMERYIFLLFSLLLKLRFALSYKEETKNEKWEAHNIIEKFRNRLYVGVWEKKKIYI